METAGIWDVVIVGSGMAAQAAGHRLKHEGWRIVVLDKARGVGGRMASRRIGEATFDHGAQYFTVRSHDFSEKVHSWEQYGLVDAWFHASTGGGEGHFRYRGKPTMTAMAKHFAETVHPVERQAKVTTLSRIDGVWRVACEDGREWYGRALVLTPPMPQSVALLEPFADLFPAALWQSLSEVRYNRTLTAMLRLDRPSALPAPGYLAFDELEPVMTLIDNQQKGISEEPAATVHMGPAFSDRYYDAPNEERLPLILDAAAPHLQAEVVESQVHRWGQSACLNPLDLDFASVPALNLWLAGDSFRASRIEAAFLSGRAAAMSVCEALGQQGSPEVAN